MMVDPAQCTNYARSPEELEEFALFAILVAGKRARTTARCLERLLARGSGSPFTRIQAVPAAELPACLREAGVGCYALKARALRALATAGLDLRTCTAADLEALPGVGPKTSRFFLLHSRAGTRVAVLDTHILRYLRACGLDTPRCTPSGPRYARLEEQFLALCDRLGRSPADLDLAIWNYYSGSLPGAPEPPIVRLMKGD